MWACESSHGSGYYFWAKRFRPVELLKGRTIYVSMVILQVCLFQQHY